MHRFSRAMSAVVAVGLFVSSSAWGVFDKRFDVCSIQCTPDGSDPHFCLANFNQLNWVSTNGHMLMMGTDTYRSNMATNGNILGAYYNNLSGLYGTYTGTQAADQIENYILANFLHTGTEVYWVSVNEISDTQWPGSSAYRSWLKACISRLNVTYGHSVILFSPFPAPLNNAADWVALSANCKIAIEKYLSGAAVNASGNSISWCQTQYQDALTHYLNLGIASSQLYLSEHFAQTVSGTAWGRGGCSYAGWDNAIHARSVGAHNCGFAGFVSYGWEHNGMLVSEADMIHFEATYAAQTLP
jgi:hypothetical protein